MALPCWAGIWKILFTVGLVLFYYSFSIGITFYNKWLLKKFHFPLFMTLVHLLIIFVLSALSRTLMTCVNGRTRVILPWSDYLKKVAPTALATALDIGLSNWSFLYITVSLYTMTKSSAVLFILLFSLLFKLEELKPALILVVLLISGGLFMFTFKSTQFDARGFFSGACCVMPGWYQVDPYPDPHAESRVRFTESHRHHVSFTAPHVPQPIPTVRWH